MASFAEIESTNRVMQIIKINNDVVGEPELMFPDTEPIGQRFIADVLGFNGLWIQTSYTGNFRGKYAAIGDVWDGTNFATPIVEEL